MNVSTSLDHRPADLRPWTRWLVAAATGLATLTIQAQTTGCAPPEYASLPIVNTGLPVVQIWTDGLQPVLDRENYLKGCMRITDGTSVRYGQGIYHGTVEIRGRGNSTWNMPKKPYRVKLTAAAQVLDMPAARDWVLLANYADKTMLRTDVAFEMSRRIGFAFTPRMRHADVYLNNEFLGSYQIGDRVEVGPTRVAITKMATTDITAPAVEGGYLLQAEYPDRLETGDVAFTTSFHNFLMDSPSGSSVQPAQLAYLSNWMQSLENAIMRQDFSATGVPAWIDVDTVVQFYLVQELLKNKDAAMGSDVNFYKDRGAVMKMGPLWDFDIAAGNIDFYPPAMQPQGWYLQTQTPWFDALLKTQAFKDKVKQHWPSFRDSIRNIGSYIDSQAAMLNRSQQANFQRWPILNTYVWPNQVVTGSYAGEVAWLKNWLAQRVAWMDSQLAPVVTPVSYLVNGSFETNNVAPNTWTYVPNGSLQGWASDAGWIQVWKGGNGGWTAANGTTWIELDSDTHRDRVYQRIATVPGETLEITFAYSARPGTSSTSNRFDVQWNGNVIARLAPSGSTRSTPSWQTVRYTVRATGNDTIAFNETGTNDSYGTLIDNVVVRQVLP